MVGRGQSPLRGTQWCNPMMTVAWHRIFKVAEWVLVLALLSVPALRIMGWIEGQERAADPVPDRSPVPELIQPGTTFDSEALQPNGGKNAILFTSTTCPYSNADIEFYRNLGDWATRVPSDQFIVVSDESPATVRRWLNTHGITTNRVVSTDGVDLYLLGVIATPTVASMNEGGIVTGLIVGELTRSQEDSFLHLLSSGRGGPMNNYLDPPVMSNEMFEHLVNDGNSVVLDIRDRNDYRSGHYPQAINIPADELGIRGPVEIEIHGRVFVDCRVGHLGDCREAARWMVLDGFRDVVVVVP